MCQMGKRGGSTKGYVVESDMGSGQERKLGLLLQVSSSASIDSL